MIHHQASGPKQTPPRFIEGMESRAEQAGDGDGDGHGDGDLSKVAMIRAKPISTRSCRTAPPPPAPRKDDGDAQH